jgi:hypothetical protein|tara:strand:- start:735 stop:1304 length:570 start_codon:yes stop_codon:yes gene_type:complete
MQVFRSGFARAIALVLTLVLLLSVGYTAITVDTLQGISLIPITLLIISITWVLFWFPRVQVDEGGVRIINLVSTHYISWAAIQRIDTRFALTIFTEGKKYSAWGAPAPGRHASFFATRDQGRHLPETTYLAGTVRPGDLINSDSGAAAAVIRSKWETKRESGQAAVSTSWHFAKIAVLLLLMVTAVVVG